MCVCIYITIENSTCSLLVYSKAIDFYIINLVFCNLTRVAYYLQETFCLFFWNLCINNHVIYEQRKFYFFLLNMYIFYVLFLSIALVLTSRMKLEKNGERGQLCVLPNLSGKTSSFSSLTMMLTVGFV